MTIIVDTNEEVTSPETVEELRTVFPHLMIGNLYAGDVNVILQNGEILAVERKTAQDFLASIADGRLFSQVERMAEIAKYSAVVLVGKLAFDENDMVVVGGRETGWKGVSVRGAMYALQYSGCPLIFAPKKGYASILLELVNFVSNPAEHYISSKKRIVTFPPLDTQTEILSSFPGIGLKRAKSLIEFCGEDGKKGTLAECLAWGTVLNLLDKSTRPQGWGDVTIENFRTVLGLHKNQYLDIREEK